MGGSSHFSLWLKVLLRWPKLSHSTLQSSLRSTMAFRGRFGPLLTLLLLAVAVWLQGCGDDTDSTDSTDNSTDSTDTAQTSTAGTILTSTGLTESSPHCSWFDVCFWNAASQEACALALCRAQNYTSGTFVIASNDPCSKGFTTDDAWHYDFDSGSVVHRKQFKNTQITAVCQD